ncbi:12615_t:CDS:2 [Funneliformis mosseae]|uniref:12615_t:CDS:1 n=1 Tax=Funneliformis mosseae TaxID=27381 RepID=A0A9N8YUU2_FUNMO|nr:12615_t:CDS:2 [Funneliformis mosseae]
MLMAGTAVTTVVTEAILGPIAFGGVVAALGFTEAAGLGIWAVIAAGSEGGIFGGFIAKAILKILSNHEGLTELDNFSFLKGFDLAQQISQNRIKNFEFKPTDEDFTRDIDSSNDLRCGKLCLEGLEGSNFLYKHLIETYGNDCVTSEQGYYFLNLNNLCFSKRINGVILLFNIQSHPIKDGHFSVAGAILGPIAICWVVKALGFGEAGIAAGSIAAWMVRNSVGIGLPNKKKKNKEN